MPVEYTVEVKVIAPDGSTVFELKVDASEDELILPGHVTPGLKPVMDVLAKVNP